MQGRLQRSVLLCQLLQCCLLLCGCRRRPAVRALHSGRECGCCCCAGCSRVRCRSRLVRCQRPAHGLQLTLQGSVAGSQALQGRIRRCLGDGRLL
jgi:hypothetical protein